MDSQKTKVTTIWLKTLTCLLSAVELDSLSFHDISKYLNGIEEVVDYRDSEEQRKQMQRMKVILSFEINWH